VGGGFCCGWVKIKKFVLKHFCFFVGGVGGAGGVGGFFWGTKPKPTPCFVFVLGGKTKGGCFFLGGSLFFFGVVCLLVF